MRTKRTYFLFFLLIAIFAFSMVSLISTYFLKSADLNINSADNTSLGSKFTSNEFYGSGCNIGVDEHALNFSTLTGLTPASSIYGTVPVTWQAYNAKIDISSLQEAGQWLDNYDISGSTDWTYAEQATGDPSDIEGAYQSGDTYTANPGGSLQIRLDGWSATQTEVNGELNGATGWSVATGTSAYGSENRAPDTYQFTTGGWDGTRYYVFHNTQGDFLSYVDEEFSVKVYQTVSLPVDGDWEITSALLTYYWRMFDNGAGQDDWFQAHLRIGNTEVDGHPFLYYADGGVRTRNRASIDVTYYFQSGTSWVIDFGFVGYINAPPPWQTEDIDAYFADVFLTINYRQKINSGTEAYWSQLTNFDYGGRDIQSATLDLAFRSTAQIPQGALSYIWAQVGSSGEWGTRHYIAYSGAYQTLDVIQTTWRIADSMNVISDLRNFATHGQIEVRVGLTIAGIPFGLSNDVDIRFDYIRLTTQAFLDPDHSSINFRVNDVTHGTPYGIIETGQGMGSRSISGTWTGGINHQFSFLINAQTYSVSFNSYLQMNETRHSIAISNFTARDPYIFDDIEWNVYFDPINLDRISKYEFTIQVPNDWEPDRIWLPGSAINYELKTQAQIMKITEPSAPNNNTLEFYDPFVQNQDGQWHLRFYAPNYVYQIKNQLDTGTWIDASKVYPTNNTRINVLIKNDSMYWSQGVATRTVYQIEDEDRNPMEQIVDHMWGPVAATEDDTLWVIPNDAIGTYKATFRWNDSSTGQFPSKVGFNYSIFEVWRKTSINYYIENAPDYFGTYLQPQFLDFLAQWTDSLSGTAIQDGTFYIEYNDRTNTPKNYTNFIEGIGASVGNYSIGLPSINLYVGPQTFTLFLFRYYYDSKIEFETIQQTIDLSTEVLTPLAKWNTTTYYVESLEIYNYNITCKFYDEYQQDWIVNGTDPWLNVEVTAQYVGGPLEYFSIDPNDNALWFFTIDTSAFTGYRTYNVTMRVLDSSPFQYPFEVQSFLVRIQIVYSQTDLVAVQTSITYPPTGTGNGWSNYDNQTDVYTANIYWNESFMLRIGYMNVTSGSIPITSATVQMIGWPNTGTLYNLADVGGGYYAIQLIANTSYPIGAYDLYINASKPGCLSKTIHVKLNVIARSTELIKAPTSAYKLVSWGGNYQILFTYSDKVPTIPVPMKNQSVPIILTITGYSSSDYIMTDFNNGTYGILLFGNASIAEYDITFEFTRTNFDTKIFTLTFKIELVHTTVVVEPPLVSMAYGDETNLTVTFYDVDNNYIGINGNLTVEWFPSYYQIVSFNNGTWIISLQAEKMGTFYLNLSLTEVNYQSQYEQIKITIREAITILTYDPPGSVPITAGGNITITLYYEDLDHNLPVTGATIDLLSLKNATGYEIPLTYWTDWVIYDRGDGSYDVEFDMYNLGVGYYNSSFNVSKPYLKARQIYNLQFNIRRAFTQLTSPEAPSATIPKGYYNITLNYRNRETGVGFNNISSDVHLVWDFPVNQTVYPNVTRVYQNLGTGVDGYYFIELNITADYIVPDHMFILYVHMSAGEYVEEQEMNITIIITPAGTIIGYETPDAVVWNVNSVFNVTYTDLAGLAVPNATISDITINWSVGYYSITYVGGVSGIYQISLNTSAYPPPTRGFFALRVQAAHTGYTARIIYVNIRVRPIDSLVTYTAPPSTPYNEISTFSLRYWNVYGDLPINGTSISIKASYLASDLGAYFSWEYDISEGYFNLHVNTSYWNKLGNFQIQTAISWGGQPYYQNQSVGITVPVQARTTDLSYLNLETTPYNDSIIFNVIYKDVIAPSNPGIESTSITVWYKGSLWSNGSNFALVTEIGNGDYEISINSAQLPTLGSFTFQIKANWVNIPFYQNKSINVAINLIQRSTELNFEIEGSVPFSNIAAINVTYSDIATDLGISNTSFYGGGRVRIDVYYQGQLWSNGTDFAWVTEVSEITTPGLYIVSINTTYLGALGTFQFSITANWQEAPFFQNKTRQISVTTRQRNTDLSFDAPPSTPIADLVNVSLYFNDLDIGAGIDNSTNNIIFIANLTQYRIYDLNSQQKGKYALEIDTSDPLLTIGSFIIKVEGKCLGAPYYTNKTRYISLTIKLISTSLTVIDYERVTWWNENITVILKFNDTDHNNLGINSPTIGCGWGVWSYTEVGQGGIYLKLNTSVPLTNYITWISFTKTNYVSQNITIPFTVRQIFTNYQTNTSFVSNHPWSYNFTAAIQYLDVDNIGLVSNLDLTNIVVEGNAPWGTGGDFSIRLIGGIFYVEFNTSACVEGFIYTINVTLSKTNYQTQKLQIRASVIYPPTAIFIKDISPATNIPWGQELRVIISYNDTEGYNGISNSSGDVNLWLEGAAGEPGWPKSNYTIFENTTLGNGVFTIFINTTWDARPEGTYQLKILANATRFHTAIAIASITIRQTITDLIMTDGPSSIFFGSSDTFTFWFNNTESVGDRREEGLTPATIQVWYKLPNGTLFEWNSPIVGGQYSIVNEGAGKYSVTINASTNLGTGQFQLYLNATLDPTWGIWQYHYEMGEFLYNLRIIDIDTIITIVEQPSGAIAWGDNFTIRIRYNDTVNNIGIIGASIDVFGASSLWTVYYNQTVTNPTYLIEINSTWVNVDELGNSFAISIQADKINYKLQLVNVFVIIRDIRTTLSYDPFSPTPYNNTASTDIYYRDVIHSVYITNNSGQVKIILYNVTTGLELSIGYSSSYTGVPGKYSISIETADLPRVGTYQINASIFWQGMPYYENQSLIIELVVRKISTLISIRPITPVPWDNNVSIVLDYTISDFESIENGNPISYSNIVLLNGSGLTNYPIIYSVQYPLQTGIAGRYVIKIDKSNFQQVKSYDLWIYMNYTNCFAANASTGFQTRNLTTSAIIAPIDIEPYGNHVNVSVQLKVVDIESDRHNSLISGARVNITTPSFNIYGDYNTGNYSVIEIGGGNYIIQIWNKSILAISSFNFEVLLSGIPYHNEATNSFSIQIRNLTTAVYILPIPIEPWGNSVNITAFYRVLDSSSLFYNNKGITGATLNVTTPGLDVYGDYNTGNYTVIELGSGYYRILLFNHSVDQIRNDYFVNLRASQVIYHDESTTFSNFEIRNLTTAITVDAIPPRPWGNDVNLTVHYRVQDPQSRFLNYQPITGARINITGYTYGSTYLVYEIGSGNYVVQVKNATILAAGTYILGLKAGGVLTFSEATTQGSFDVRPLVTVLEILPVNPVPFGNHANITVLYKVSDPESLYWNGLKVPGANINVTTPNYDIFGTYQTGNYSSKDLSLWGYYSVLVYNHSLPTIGSYLLEIRASGYLNIQEASSSITFEVRPLYTFLTYTPIAAVPWGDNVTLSLQWLIKDTASIYHNLPIANGAIEIYNPSNWSYYTDYTYKDKSSGVYSLNISSNTVNLIKLYTIQAKIYGITNIYYNATSDITFQVRQVFTTHSVIINGTYTGESYSGWPWGANVPITIFYNVSELTHASSELVINSEIIVTGPVGTPYQSGNYSVINHNNGTFSLIINGLFAEHGVPYSFDILLFTPAGTHQNDSTTRISIWFRKAMSQIFLKDPPLFVPWGDNITLVFTYNNTEATGDPGISNAFVNVTVSNSLATSWYNFYENSIWGNGSWYISMNTTWAEVTYNKEQSITFEIFAVSPGTITAKAYYTVIIQPLNTELRIQWYDAAIWLETVHSFNATLELTDRSHFNTTLGSYNPIQNNSYWMDGGSPGQYNNVHFNITTREGNFGNYSWFWGDVLLYPTPTNGIYTLMFLFNQTPTYPPIQELTGYSIFISVYGDRFSVSSTQITVDLRLHTHDANVTFDWNYANTTITPLANLSQFEPYQPSYYYGDLINITLFFWDLDSGAYNPGISSALITCDWVDPLYYRVFNEYQLHNLKPEWLGIFTIQIDTRMFDDITGNYTLEINATLETYQRAYITIQPSYYIQFQLLPVPVEIQLVEPIISTPITAWVHLLVNFTNLHTNEAVFVRLWEVDIPNIAGPMGGSKWAQFPGIPGQIELFIDSNVLGLGVHTLTVQLNKPNHEIVSTNFTAVVRPIKTEIIVIAPIDDFPAFPDESLNTTYRHGPYTYQFYYKDTPEDYIHGYNHIDRIPGGSFDISNWREVGGTAELITANVPFGIYELAIYSNADVGFYNVILMANRTNYAPANKTIQIKITPADTTIELVDPISLSFDIWKFGSEVLKIRFMNEFNEPITNAIINYTIKDFQNNIMAFGLFTNDGNGYYTATIGTEALNMEQKYLIIINATPDSKNYQVESIVLEATIKPFWEHPIFIFAMIGLAATIGIIAYRRVKWMLLPREIKAVELAKRVIKKNKEAQIPFRDMRDRELMFRMEYAAPWAALDMKPPKLVSLDVIAIATELSSILRTRVTTPEAETLKSKLQNMELEDAERYLSDLKVPPAASRRILGIVGLVRKERMEFLEWARVFSEIKGVDMDYNKAEDIITTILSLPPVDADRYLEAMVISTEDRARLLRLLGIEPPIEYAGKVKFKEEAAKPKKEVKEEKKAESGRPSMTEAEILEELNKIPGLNYDEKKKVLDHIKNMPYDEQKMFLESLKS